MRRIHTLDQLVGCMVPHDGDPAIPQNSPLFDEELLEFETEYASETHVFD